MKKLTIIMVLFFAGCTQVQDATNGLFSGSGETAPQAAEQEAPEPAVEEGVAENPDPPESFDPGWQGARQTIAGLGDPSIPGVWMETPLVTLERSGRIVDRKTGASAFVTLLPAGGDPGAGSRLSLGAMRAILAPIDQLVELDVYAN